MKNIRFYFGITFALLCLMGATTSITWLNIRSSSRHGNGTVGQSSDGTGSSTHIATFDANGNVTNGAATLDSSGNLSILGSGTGKLNLTGATSGSTVAVTVGASTAAGTFTIPGVTGTGAYVASARTSGHCAQYDTDGIGLTDAGAACGTGGGGTTVSAAAPYIVIGGTKYVGATLWPYTALFSGSWLGSGAGYTGSITSGANGSSLITPPSSPTVDIQFYGVSATTSVEAEYNMQSANTAASMCIGTWVHDTTNSVLYLFGPCSTASTSATNAYYFQSLSYSSGNPGACCSALDHSPSTWPNGLPGSVIHTKMSVSGGTLSCQISGDGGQTFYTADTHSIGTVDLAGVYVSGEKSGQTSKALMIVYSITTN